MPRRHVDRHVTFARWSRIHRNTRRYISQSTCSINPLSSPTPMKSAGRSGPRCSWFQRSSASCPLHGTVGQLHDRLEIRFEGIVEDGAAQVGFEVEQAQRLGAHGLVEQRASDRGRAPWRGTSRHRRRAACPRLCDSAVATRRCRCSPTGTARGLRSTSAAPSTSRTRDATASAAEVSAMFSARIANSSPPRRATTSLPSSTRAMRLPDSTSISSPEAWPTLSLTSLKRSRSRNSTANGKASDSCMRVDRSIHAFQQMGAVRQSGQLVVHRLVGELLLGAQPLADLRAQLAVACSPVRVCALRRADSSSACATIRCSCARLRARPLSMWWATNVSNSWSRCVKLMSDV